MGIIGLFLRFKERRLNPKLTQSLQNLEAHFRRDERCLGMFLWGSLGRESADAYSDVDVGIVVRDEDYAAMKAELYGTCEAACGKIVVWLPEGETADHANFAFLYESGEDVLLYDFFLTSHSALPNLRLGIGSILFDRAGIFQDADWQKASPAFPGEKLAGIIDQYWVYMYLNGKYFRRADRFKLLYVQDILFQAHLRVLNALSPEQEWGWWANDIKRLPEPHRRELLVYFGDGAPERISEALRAECDLFSRDARAACQQWRIAYPHRLEADVIRHLTAMGALR
jgi:predicted nucleotidyltransferase